MDFNVKLIKANISSPATISEKGAMFSLDFVQNKCHTIINCFIPANNTYLVKNAAEEYLISENIGKAVVILGTDVYEQNILLVQRIFFIDALMSKTEADKKKAENIDFSKD